MWNKTCAEILIEYVQELDKIKIKYFILRNHYGLPNRNEAKDVDIVIEPGRVKEAKKKLRIVLKKKGMEYYDEFVTGDMICTHGMSLNSKIGIHVDLLDGMNIKGYELIDFDQLYKHTQQYNKLNVLEDKYENLWIFICKQFGQKRLNIKDNYKNKIYSLIEIDKDFFLANLSEIASKKYASKIEKLINGGGKSQVFKSHKQLDKCIKRKAWRRRPMYTIKKRTKFVWEKVVRIIFKMNKNSRNFAVIAPDGSGKSTFIDKVIEEINYYYISDDKVSLYHFRPGIFPNLRRIGEKTRIMEAEITNNDPHKNKPVGLLSSLIRMIYYIMDYIIGWQKVMRRDVHYDKYSVYDRYSYDLLVDPFRSRIKLPAKVRTFFVALTPKPKIVFRLTASPEVIYSRKQELNLNEIKRQSAEYDKLSNSKDNIYDVNAEQNLEEMSQYAMEIIMDKYCK